MKQDYEKTGIKISMSGSILLSTIAIFMAIITESQTVLFDGLYTFVVLVMSFISLKVINVVKKLETRSKPLGYTALEPLLNLIKCIFVLLILLIFLITNIQELCTGGRVIPLNLITLYIFICIFIYLLIIFLIRRCGKKSNSSILKLEIRNWYIDTFLTFGIAVSLVIAIILYNLGYTKILPYVDPIIVIILVLIALPISLQVFFSELKKILLISDENSTENEIKEQLKQIILKYCFQNIQVWSLKSGRMLYFFIFIYLKTDETKITSLDTIRHEIFVELHKTYPDFWADIMFTRVNPEVPFDYENQKFTYIDPEK